MDLEKSIEIYIEKMCIEEGKISTTMEIVKLLPESKRIEKLEKVLEKCIRKGKLDIAMQIVELLPEPKKSESLGKILEKCIEEGKLITTS